MILLCFMIFTSFNWMCWHGLMVLLVCAWTFWKPRQMGKDFLKQPKNWISPPSGHCLALVWFFPQYLWSKMWISSLWLNCNSAFNSAARGKQYQLLFGLGRKTPPGKVRGIGKGQQFWYLLEFDHLLQHDLSSINFHYIVPHPSPLH